MDAVSNLSFRHKVSRFGKENSKAKFIAANFNIANAGNHTVIAVSILEPS
jgi:hypothetical protein